MLPERFELLTKTIELLFGQLRKLIRFGLEALFIFFKILNSLPAEVVTIFAGALFVPLGTRLQVKLSLVTNLLQVVVLVIGLWIGTDQFNHPM